MTYAWDGTTDAPGLRRFLHALPGVDEVGAHARAAMLSTRSVKTTSKCAAIDLAISMVDLTTLEGSDTRGKVTAMCAKAVRPDPLDAGVPSAAAVCVYSDMVKIARDAVGDAVHVAAVATAFPSGRASLAVKETDTQDAIANGAGTLRKVDLSDRDGGGAGAGEAPANVANILASALLQRRTQMKDEGKSDSDDDSDDGGSDDEWSD